MWIRAKGRDFFMKVKAIGLVQENKRLFHIVGSFTGIENQGVVLGKFRDEVVAKKCIKGFEKALIEGNNYFDINSYKTK